MNHGKLNIFLCTLWLFFFILPYSYGQTSPCHEPSGKTKKLFQKGKESWGSNKEKAKSFIFRAIQNDAQWAEPYYFLAQNYYKQAENSKYDRRKVQNLNRLLNLATDNFEKVIDICPSTNGYKSLYYMGKIYYEGGDLGNAEKWLSKYTRNVNKDQYLPHTNKMYDKCISYKKLVNNPVDFNPVSVVGVCSSNDEFMPLIAPDGSYMFFTRKLWKQERGQYSPKMVEEFSISSFIRWDSTGNPVFDDAKPMPHPFNQGSNQGAASITINNKKLFITVCKQIEMPDGRLYKNCDIYHTIKNNGRWGELKKLPRQINGLTTWEGHPSISPDGKTLYFASYRPGGNGGIDIYYSNIDSTEKWGNPVNIGRPVNTDLNERAPFIHPDNKTLYFASDGHAGVGGYDIFYSRFKDSVWTTPKNIGYPINSKKDESGFIVSTNGHYAFFSSNAYKGYGGYDIFGFELYKDAQPDEVLFVKGKLKDGNGAILRNAAVEVKNIKTQKIRKGLVDNTTGKYAIAMPAVREHDYIMTVKKTDYTFTSKIISPEADTTPKNLELEMNFAVKKANVGANTRLNNVFFPFNSTDFTEHSQIMLDHFTEYLKENPSLEIRIEGHTDSIAEAGFNLRLSKKRAQKVYRYLAKKGIKRSRLSYKGYGETKPQASNTTEKGRAKNRRTEFVITKK